MHAGKLDKRISVSHGVMAHSYVLLHLGSDPHLSYLLTLWSRACCLPSVNFILLIYTRGIIITSSYVGPKHWDEIMSGIN